MRKIIKLLPLLCLLITPISIIENTASNNKEEIVYAVDSYPALSDAETYFNYWRGNVRKNPTDSICDIEISLFNHLYQQFQTMVPNEQTKLNTEKQYEDTPGVKIKDTLLYLNSKFYPVKSSKSNDHLLQEDTTLPIIIAIAFFGMTAIALFYVLKHNHTIE